MSVRKQTFSLYRTEREELAAHLATEHDGAVLPADDVAAFEAHATLHPDVTEGWSRYSPEAMALPDAVKGHHERLSELRKRLRQVRKHNAEVDREDAAKKAIKDYAVDGKDLSLVLAVMREDKRTVLSASQIDHAVANKLGEAMGVDVNTADFPAGWIKARLDLLAERGDLDRYKGADLPAVEATVTDKYWYYCFPERMTALVAAVAAAKAARGSRKDRWNAAKARLETLGEDYAGCRVQAGWRGEGEYDTVDVPLEVFERFVDAVTERTPVG